MAELISVTTIGFDEVAQGMQSLSDQVQDLRVFWREIFAPEYYGLIDDLFATQGRARGGDGRFKSGAWPALSPRYRVWKTKHYPGRPMLVLTGRLRESVRWGGSAPGAEGFFSATETAVQVGTTVPYAAAHMTGTARMPARPFMPPVNTAVFAPLMAAWIVRTSGMSAAGPGPPVRSE